MPSPTRPARLTPRPATGPAARGSDGSPVRTGRDRANCDDGVRSCPASAIREVNQRRGILIVADQGSAQRANVGLGLGHGSRGKRPQFKARVRRGRQPGDWRNPTNSNNGWGLRDGPTSRIHGLGLVRVARPVTASSCERIEVQGMFMDELSDGFNLSSRSSASISAECLGACPGGGRCRIGHIKSGTVQLPHAVECAKICALSSIGPFDSESKLIFTD
jgi:hypothetical protein